MLAVLLYHDLRATELFSLRVKDYAARRGIGTLVVHGKGSKLRYIPVHPKAVAAVNEYLAECPHAGEEAAPLFIPKGQIIRPRTSPADFQVGFEPLTATLSHAVEKDAGLGDGSD
jgi:site-specific recombinase XerC